MSQKPLVEYDERYFTHSKHNAKELYDIQARILSIIGNGSSDILKELDSEIDPKEIDIILRESFQKGLTKRERTGMIVINPDHKIPIYRYYR